MNPLIQDIDILEAAIEAETRGNNLPALGTAVGDLTGVPFSEVPKRSACATMKWIYNNTGYRFKPFFELDFEDSRQGVRIYNGQGAMVKEFSKQVTGGDDSDPAKQLTRDMYTMIKVAVEYVQERI